MKKFALILIPLFFLIPKANADVVSLQSNYVAGESNIVSHLNNDRTSLTNGVNNIQGCQTGSIQSSGQVKDATICDENMYDDASPHLRTYEGAACEFVYTGLLPTTTSGTLVGNIPSGTAYPQGYRVVKSSSTAHVFGASLWTYIDLDKSGTFVYSTQTIGGTTPSVATNAIRIARVSTDSTQILAVQDLRKTSCTAGPFSGISNATQEATLADIFANGRPGKYSDAGIVNGLQVSYDTASTFVVKKGAAYINGKYRTLASDLTITKNTADDPLNGGSGIDSGSTTASTGYFIFGVADQDSSPNMSVTYSSSATPAGITNSRLLGRVRTDTATNFVSDDVNYVRPGRSYQKIASFDGTIITTTSVIPYDNTPGLISEGAQIMSATITPMNANHRLRIHAHTFSGGGSTTMTVVGTLMRSTDASARKQTGGCSVSGSGGSPICNLDIVLDEVAGTTSPIIYTFRAGPGSAATAYFNGDASAVQLFGSTVADTYITIDEYER